VPYFNNGEIEMIDKLKMVCLASAELIRAPKAPQGDSVSPKGRYKVEHFRNGVKIGEYEAVNTTTNEGRAKLLNVMFDGTTPITAWYLGLAVTSTNFQPTDNYANSPSPAWSEFTTYAELVRQAWTVVASTAANPAVTTNTASVAAFTMATGTTITGLILVGGGSAASTKGDTAGGGVLWSGAQFTGQPTGIVVASADVLKVTYSVSVGA